MEELPHSSVPQVYVLPHLGDSVLWSREKGTRNNFPGLLHMVVQAVYCTTLGASFGSEML